MTAHEGRDINNVTAEEKVLSAALTRQKRGEELFYGASEGGEKKRNM